MGASGGVRYRYKGAFISAGKAASLSNLKNASRYITTEYTYKGKADTIRKGYLEDVEKLMKRAAAAREPHRPPEVSPQKFKRLERDRKEKNREQARVSDIARRAVRYAEQNDIDVDDALDAFVSAGEYAPGQFEHYDAGDISAMAREAMDYGEELLDFEMADLETEGERIS